MYKGYEKSQFSINISFNLENDTRYRPMFDNNFSKCGPIFKILSPIRKKILYVQTTRFPSHLQYVDNIVKFENPKMLYQYSRWTWQY